METKATDSKEAVITMPGKYHDFKIICGNTTLVCHRAYLTNHSPYLSELIDSAAADGQSSCTLPSNIGGFSDHGKSSEDALHNYLQLVYAPLIKVGNLVAVRCEQRVIQKHKYVGGESVRAKWQTGPQCYDAYIMAANTNGTYVLLYSDGHIDYAAVDSSIMPSVPLLSAKVRDVAFMALYLQDTFITDLCDDYLTNELKLLASQTKIPLCTTELYVFATKTGLKQLRRECESRLITELRTSAAPPMVTSSSWRYHDTNTGQLVLMIDQLDAKALRAFVAAIRTACQPAAAAVDTL